MKLIPLTQGLFARVDDWWFEELNQYKWYADKGIGTFYVYAVRHGVALSGKQTTICMHRVIMDTPSELVADHIDHNGLNNLEENLRNCTRAENLKNRRAHGKSKYLGVYFMVCKVKGKIYTYIASDITVGGKIIHLGHFPTEELAALVYDVAAKKHHGEFANLNFG